MLALIVKDFATLEALIERYGANARLGDVIAAERALAVASAPAPEIMRARRVAEARFDG